MRCFTSCIGSPSSILPRDSSFLNQGPVPAGSTREHTGGPKVPPVALDSFTRGCAPGTRPAAAQCTIARRSSFSARRRATTSSWRLLGTCL